MGSRVLGLGYSIVLKDTLQRKLNYSTYECPYTLKPINPKPYTLNPIAESCSGFMAEVLRNGV